MIRPRHRSDSGFTLIELLVVISLIAILAGMLIPAVGAIRAQAQSAVCQSNQRQIHMALMSYAGDNTGHLPFASYWSASGSPTAPTVPWYVRFAASGRGYASDGTTPIESWGQNMAVYLELPLSVSSPSQRSRLGIFNCPMNTRQTQCMGVGLSELDTSYQGNGWNAFNQWHDGLFFGTHLRTLTNQGRLIAFYDGRYPRTEAWNNDGAGTVDGSGILPARASGIRNVRYVHRGRTNVCYADGHIDARAELVSNVYDSVAWYGK